MLSLAPAAPDDYPAIIALTNRAYRVAEGQAAWKVETFVGGQRLDDDLLAEDLAQPGANLLIARDEAGAHLGHVRLDEGEGGVWFLAMLTVAPDRQDGGLGRAILEAAEAWVRARGGKAIQMTVIRQREELIAWYGRRGYTPTGETKPFPYGDKRFGEPTRDDLVFEVLETRL